MAITHFKNCVIAVAWIRKLILNKIIWFYVVCFSRFFCQLCFFFSSTKRPRPLSCWPSKVASENRLPGFLKTIWPNSKTITLTLTASWGGTRNCAHFFLTLILRSYWGFNLQNKKEWKLKSYGWKRILENFGILYEKKSKRLQKI